MTLFQIPVKLSFYLFMIIIALLSLRSFVIIAQLLEDTERDSLSALKSSLDSPFLNSLWNTTAATTTTSKWHGIRRNSDGFVTEIVLESMGLRGNIAADAFSGFAKLSVLSLRNNSLGGTAGLDFAFNRKLTRLDLSGNEFSGPIPVSLLGIPGLSSILLNDNALTGPILGFNQSGLRVFNVSNNNLSGPIPKTRALQLFSYSSFHGNPRLCGPPSPTACNLALKTESSLNDQSSSDDQDDNIKKSFTESLKWYMLPFEFVLLVVLVLLFILYCKKSSDLKKKKKKKMARELRNNRDTNSKEDQEEGVVDQQQGHRFDDRRRLSSEVLGQEDRRSPAGKLTFVSGDRLFEASDLLKGTAEGLGKGCFGNCYKVVMEMEGKAAADVVVVKRLRNVKPTTEEEFERQLVVIAGLKHPNLLPLLAYNNSNGEKWLLHNYVEKGNLFHRLHGGRLKNDELESERVSFRWRSRLHVARGVARAMSHLHQNTALLLPHGNLKSTNVLLLAGDAPLVSDYALAPLLALPVAAAAFQSPECRSASGGRRASRKSDVWSYGCLLLELLTGRAAAGAELAAWAHRAVREEWTAEVFDREIFGGAGRRAVPAMLRLLEIALMCVERAPERRPEMSGVARMVEDVRPLDAVSEDDESSSSFERSLTDDSSSVDRS